MTREEAIRKLQMRKAEYLDEWVDFSGIAEAYDMAIEALSADAAQPTIEERKTGKWTEKHHAYFDEEKAIEEWQSCKCSVCGRYDTRPYMYYFNEPHFCSWCGADMRGTE